MRLSRFALDYEEHVTETFTLPGGRRLIAQLTLNPSTPVGPAPAEPDTLQAVIESRRAGSGEAFVEIARTEALSQAGTVSVDIPTPEEPVPVGEQPPVARVRLVHTGRLMPRFELNIFGL